MIEIYIENTHSPISIKPGMTLAEISDLQNIKLKNPILGAMVNNQLKELYYNIFRPKNIRFIDITHPDGMRMYIRSLFFVLLKAAKDVYPEHTLKIEHSVSKGFYCEFDNLEQISEINVAAIVRRMHEIVKADIPFEHREISVESAIKLFDQNNYVEKARLFRTHNKLYTSIYCMGDFLQYFYGYLLPGSGYVGVFGLEAFDNGMLLRVPDEKNPEKLKELILQPKLFDIFREYKKWVEILGVDTIGSINEEIMNGRSTELIQISEALHEKKVAYIADTIFADADRITVVLISGPSSSGKTTFAKRLSVQLKVLGIKPYSLSLDNYFVNREATPRDAKGDYNFEALEAIDIKLLNQHIGQLLAGHEVKLPKFSFQTGQRFYDGTSLKIEKSDLLIIEGIHALNPGLLPDIPKEVSYKIYVSALTQLGIDWHNRIPTTDNRLLRRIVRDKKYRHYSALETIERWPSVRAGEEKNIFSHQEKADIMFNSALLYELNVLKAKVAPLLQEISEKNIQYAEAKRLLKFLSYFVAIPDTDVPPTSILREFLGNSSFNYD